MNVLHCPADGFEIHAGKIVLQRATLELRPVILFVKMSVGVPHFQMLYSFFTSVLPSCFVSWQHALKTLW